MKSEFIFNNSLNVVISILFIIFYFFIAFENFIKVKKSSLSILFSTVIWILLAFFSNIAEKDILNYHIKNVLLEYCELFFFLFVAMIYINSIKDFKIFDFIKFQILKRNMSYKKIYFMTGFLSFFISPIADNLTTALLMSSIILSINDKNSEFINLSFVNIVIASNAGGVFSPFGDITTLMIWQSGVLKFHMFFYIFLPSFISFLIPSFIISLYIPLGKPEEILIKGCKIQNGFFYLIFIFLFTLVLTVFVQAYFKLPAVLGMMFGLFLLFNFEFFCKKNKIFFSFNCQINKIEWDTLFFFYGIMLCIGALSCLGILNFLSFFIYEDLFCDNFLFDKHTLANIFIGFLSSIIDNIPITFSILNMMPNMNGGQWLLVTLAVGVGGSLLSFGSAAGVALMGRSKYYTFFSHAKWSWSILLGYLSGMSFQVFLNNHIPFF